MSMPGIAEGEMIAAFDVVDDAPPIPLSCRSSPDPNAAVSAWAICARSVGISSPMKSQHFDVPPRYHCPWS